MDAYIQTALGILVSLVLFFVTYRQTIGAKKERAKNANHALQRAVMRRMVLEEYSPNFRDLNKLIEGKAREFQVSVNDLLSEEQILNSLFTEVFDSDLISPTQRVQIEARINDCFRNLDQEAPQATTLDYQQMTQETKSRKDNLYILVGLTSVMGAVSSLLYGVIESKAFNVEWLLSGAGVLVTSILALSTISIIRKNKEADEVPSRRVAQMASSEFELEIAKLLERLNLSYTIQPSLGRLRPDFIVNTGDRKIVIEAKTWGDVVPLAQVRRTMDYLSEVANANDVDQVLLVTKKKPPINLGHINNDKISVVSLSELSVVLKKAC